jgi:uncharacterized NAD-dependent epimerase/dehydratase family protein
MNTENCKLTIENRLALLMHAAVTSYFGKMGFGLMRYGIAPTVVVIDRETAGGNLRELTGIACDAPIVATLHEALAYRPDTLVPAVAPPGGVLPDDWWADIKEGVSAGLNIVNGLHRMLADDQEIIPLLRPGQWIWDIRKEPPGLENGMGRAKDVTAKRVLFVGTDMANGKMTAALEMDRTAKSRGMRSKFLATGQIGIAISGDGIALDAVRIDFATGAVEQMVLNHGFENDILFIEGQGSLLHPASTAAFALMRGAMPTHIILCHRAGQESIFRAPWVRIPSLSEVVKLYEDVSRAAGSLPGAKVTGITLNTSHMPETEARAVIAQTAEETGLAVTDVVRFGTDELLKEIL